jgi:molybdate transport system substrate-binding protein
MRKSRIEAAGLNTSATPTGTARFAKKPAPWRIRCAMGSLVFISTIFAFARAESPKIPLQHGRVSVAAAANLTHVIDSLARAFREKNAGIEVITATGSSGGLVAQITHGAPYDILLAADTQNPRALMERGQADPASFTIFAVGQLALWTTRADLELDAIASVLRQARVGHVAIANPDTAPYGRAAVQTMEKLGVWETVRGKIVTGENISQTTQLVDSGNADVGFVALSLLQSTPQREHGRWIAVPPDLHAPIEQAAVITRHGGKNEAAREFLKFLSSAEAREIFTRSGYAVP